MAFLPSVWMVELAKLCSTAFEMLSLMLCWPFLGLDDRTAQAGDGFHHGEDGDVLGLLRQRCHLEA